MQLLNMKQLEAFCTVVDSGSFTKAAETLYLAQSTVSGHVAALENELGVTLLKRTGKRHISLTEEGRRVYSHAKAILQSCSDLSEELEGENSRHLTLIGSSIPTQYILPGLIAGFCTENPDCRVTLHSGDSQRVHKALLNGEAQLGFAGADMDLKNMHYEKIAEDTLCLVTPNTTRFRTMLENGKSGNDLLSGPLIFREGGSGTQMAGQRYLAEHGISAEKLNVIARVESSEALMRMVALGAGCAVVSGLAARAHRELLSFPLQGSGNTRALFMLYPRGVRPARIAAEFTEYVLAHSMK